MYSVVKVPRKKSDLHFNSRLTVVVVALLLACIGLSSGEALAQSKGSYNLFNPTPKALMRGLSTDRPDQTESPQTVDAGHVQLELDFVNTTFNKTKTAAADLRESVYSVVPINLKVGLLNNVDVQFIFSPYISSSVKDQTTDTKETISGTGDFVTRVKVNLWGNDGGKTAFALMPFIKWPLSASDFRNGKAEGGVIVPLGIALNQDYGLGLMVELDFVRNSENDGYDTEYVQTATIARGLTDRLGGYLEILSRFSSAESVDWVGQVDGGITYGINEDLQLDIGCNFGITDNAPDFNPFAGISLRI